MGPRMWAKRINAVQKNVQVARKKEQTLQMLDAVPQNVHLWEVIA